MHSLTPQQPYHHPNLFHSSDTRFANLNRPTSSLYLLLNSLKLCPLLPSSLSTWKNLSKVSKPLRILKIDLNQIRSQEPGLQGSETQYPEPVARDVRPRGLASASWPKNLASASWVSWVVASALWILASKSLEAYNWNGTECDWK